MAASIAALAVLMVTVMGWSDGQPEQDHAQARLVCETTRLIPGTTAHIAVTWRIDPEWHLYWNGRNDSGFAPEWKLDAPPGFRVGKTQWPVPKRKAAEGDILDHIYDDAVTLIIPVDVPASAKPGSKVVFGMDVEWLVCKEACIPGSASLALEVAVTEAGKMPEASADGPLFSQARARHPRGWPKTTPPSPAFAGCSNELPTFVWAGEVLTVRHPAASKMSFYPAQECAPTPFIAKEGEKVGKEMAIRFERSADANVPKKVVGVLEIQCESGAPPMLLSIELDPGATQPGTPSGDSGGTGPSPSR